MHTYMITSLIELADDACRVCEGVGRPGCPTGLLERPGRPESLDRPLDRLSRATLLARSCSTEAPRGDLGRSWPLLGAPRPLRIAFPCARERDFSKILTSLLDGLPKPAGTHSGPLWAALGTLLGLFWALLGRAGPVLERSWGTPGSLFGALLALLSALGTARSLRDPPGIDFQGILGRFGGRSGWVWRPNLANLRSELAYETAHIPTLVIFIISYNY